MHLARLDGPYPAPMGSHDGQVLQLPRRNRFPDPSPDAGRLEPGDGSVLNIRNNGIVGLSQRAGADGNIPDAHFMNLFHYHVQYVIALSEMMMEGKGHSIPDPAFY